MQELNSQETRRLRKEIDSVQGRFFQLLSITIAVMLALAAGIVLGIFPKPPWNLASLEFERNYIPQLLAGLLILVALLCWYVMHQRRHLKSTQQELIKELVRRETAERLAVIDPLTEIYNRRYITRAIVSEASRVDRQNSKFAFLMIDVNGFKQANDSLGHLVGDRILRELARLLQRTLRTSDVISRYGGDEFLVLLIDTDDLMATRAIERLQSAVDQWNQDDTIQGYTMSISCGYAVYTRGADATAVLAAADQDMYQAKCSTLVSR
jgi:diguanylate cyclase (GGDEF)-like protein